MTLTEEQHHPDDRHRKTGTVQPCLPPQTLKFLSRKGVADIPSSSPGGQTKSQHESAPYFPQTHLSTTFLSSAEMSEPGEEQTTPTNRLKSMPTNKQTKQRHELISARTVCADRVFYGGYLPSSTPHEQIDGCLFQLQSLRHTALRP